MYSKIKKGEHSPTPTLHAESCKPQTDDRDRGEERKRRKTERKEIGERGRETERQTERQSKRERR